MTEITAKELKELQDKGEKVLAQFSAIWCGPCRALTPKLTNMSNEYENITFVKLDVENINNIELVMEMNIMSIPTVVIYDGHKIVDTSKGLQQDSYYKNVLNEL